MDIEKLNRWLALGANVAVSAGIVFLAVEIRQNSQILVEQARYSMLENQKEWAFFTAGDRDIARLIYPASAIRATVLPSDRQRVNAVETL
jgi:hypothetical protein